MNRLILIAYAIISVLGLMILLSRENVYVVGALLLSFLMLGYCELWSLARFRRLPVFDERVSKTLRKPLKCVKAKTPFC